MHPLTLYFIYLILAFNQCDYTSYGFFVAADTIGVDVEVCCGKLSNTDEFDHAWIRIHGHNFETSTLDLIKSPVCNYNTPYFVSNNRSLIRKELWA